jgi:hypothetical protein
MPIEVAGGCSILKKNVEIVPVLYCFSPGDLYCESCLLLRFSARTSLERSFHLLRGRRGKGDAGSRLWLCENDSGDRVAGIGGSCL